MSQPQWYNANSARAYPFLKGSVGARVAVAFSVEGLPNDLVVDAGFVAGLQSGFVPGTHHVWLAKLTRSGPLVTLQFASDAPGLYGKMLEFYFLTSSKGYTTWRSEADVEPTGWSESFDSLFSESLDQCGIEPLWYGFIVADPQVYASLPEGTYTPATAVGGEVEPALVQSLANSYIGSINLANDDRTRATAPDGCPEIPWEFAIGRTYVSAACLSGDVRFKAGYNATVRQDSSQNIIYLGAAKGAGDGEPCSEVPLFATEQPPAGSTLLEGGPLCDEVIRSFNGVGGQFVSLLSGTGVTITNVPASHKIIVDLNMAQLAVCYQDNWFEIVSESLYG